MSLANLVPANLARAAIEGILWSLAFGLRVLQEESGTIERVVLTGGAAQSEAVQRIAPAVFGLPVTVTDVAESVAVGAARQAAWVLTGELPDWPVPQVRTIEATEADRAAATMLDERYSATVRDHYQAPV